MTSQELVMLFCGVSSLFCGVSVLLMSIAQRRRIESSDARNLEFKRRVSDQLRLSDRELPEKLRLGRLLRD